MRSVTVTANLAAGYPLGEALDYMEKTVQDLAGDVPVQIDYDGESRELKRSSGGLMLTFAFAMLIVYLVLAAQFESFVHPLVILAAVPMALTGALFGLWLFGSSINIFSQIGAVMLVGIASKNGILIVEFANQLRDRGRGVRRSHHRGLHGPPEARADDHPGHGRGRGAADDCDGGGRRKPAVHRRHGVLRFRFRGGPDSVRGTGPVRENSAQYPLPAVSVAADRPPAPGGGQ